ncbi:unnamed protein product, partial [Closterium sp. NIES-53]
MATTTVLLQRQPSVQESLSPQQLREWAIWWGSPSGGASRARAGGAGAGGHRTRRQEMLSSQQLRKRAVRWGSPGGGAWGDTTGGPCESTPAGSAAGRRGGSGGGQQQQQRPPETLSPQQLREWAVRWGNPSGGAWGTSAGGAEPEEALHTFTLDPGASRCFLSNSTTVTPLTAPVPVTLADPSGGPVVASGTTVLPCQVAAPVEIAASCSCRLLMHQTLLWHHHLGHPSLPRLRGMHSRLLVSGLPRSLPPLSRSLAPPCFPCIEGRQRAAPHSSFPPTTAPLQTLHMDV